MKLDFKYIFHVVFTFNTYFFSRIKYIYLCEIKKSWYPFLKKNCVSALVLMLSMSSILLHVKLGYFILWAWFYDRLISQFIILKTSSKLNVLCNNPLRFDCKARLSCISVPKMAQKRPRNARIQICIPIECSCCSSQFYSWRWAVQIYFKTRVIWLKKRREEVSSSY